MTDRRGPAQSTYQLFEQAVAHHRAGRFAAAATGYRAVLAVQPRETDALHLLGVALFQMGELREAEALIRRALSLRPALAAAHNSLGNLEAARDQLDAAVACYRRALTLEPGYAEAHNNLGAALQRQGRYAEAEAACRQALSVRPDYIEAGLNRAAALRALGRFEEAASDYRRVLGRRPDHPIALSQLGQLLEDMGDGVTALASYRRLAETRPKDAKAQLQWGATCLRLGEFAAAAAAFDRATGLEPSPGEAWYGLGLARRALGENRTAAVALTRALALMPGDLRVRRMLATVRLAEGDPGAAVALLEMAAAEAPDDWAVLHELGVACQTLGRLELAVAAYRRALNLNPDLVDAEINLGAALVNLGAPPDEAIRHLKHALSVRPNSPMAHLNLGLALQRAGQMAGAEAAFRQALVLDPSYARAHNNLGNLLHDRHRKDEAVRCLETAVQRDPRYAEAWTNLGAVLADCDRVGEAEAAHRRAIALQPTLAMAWNNLALVLELQSRFEEAIAAARRALVLQPDFGDAHANLGIALWRNGEPDAAEDHLERAAGATEALSALARLNRGLFRLWRGRLAAGWADYAMRFPALGYRNRAIAAPLWQGEAVPGRLMIWREQGLGDELMFATCLPDAATAAGATTLECSPRLAGLFARSFPEIRVRPESVGPEGAETVVPPDCDRHAPVGDLPRHRRRALARFPVDPPPLRPDPAQVALWRDRIAALGPGLRVGVCWRSGRLTAERRRSYTALADWAPILRVPGIRLVNLQYDDCTAELTAVEARLGVSIARWPELDLKNDLEAVAALMVQLDLVISAPTMVAEFAGALQVPVWRCTGGADWTCLGTTVRPWFPSMAVLAGGTATLARALARGARRLADLGRAGPVAAHAGALPPAADHRSLVRLAAACHGAGRLTEAADYYRRALAVAPGDSAAQHNLGMVLERLGDRDGAERCYRAAIAGAPGQAQSHANLGNLLRLRGRFAAAEAVHRAALAIAPDRPDFLVNLGVVLAQLERFGEAEACYRRALAADPGMAAAWTNLGVALLVAGRLGDAQACLVRGVTLAPDMPDALANLGLLRQLQGSPAAAEAVLEQALAAAPDFALGAYNLALLRLGQGRLTAGWAGYAHRFAVAGSGSFLRAGNAPPWHGDALAGRTLLVWREQGVGDEVMFATLYPDLIDPNGPAQPGRVVVECDRRLLGLFGRAVPGATFVPAPDDPADPVVPAADCAVPAGSLPRRLRPRLADFPTRPVLLTPEPRHAAEAAAFLATLGPGLKVGVCWRSGLMSAERRGAYTRLDQWGPILRVPGIRFIDLQYDDSRTERAAAAARFGVALAAWDGVDLRRDLERAVALVAGLDLVISAPTAVAELAAVAGTPVWRLEPPVAWACLGTRVRPWMPAARVFQPGPGRSIDTLLPQVAAALRRLGTRGA